MARKKRQLEDACVICGDAASGVNFKALTCKPCKAFFIRAMSKHTLNMPKCPLEGRCRVNILTRRFCAACRIDKCFAVGMKKEFIFTNKENQMTVSTALSRRYKRILEYKKLILDVPTQMEDNSCDESEDSMKEENTFSYSNDQSYSKDSEYSANLPVKYESPNSKAFKNVTPVQALEQKQAIDSFDYLENININENYNLEGFPFKPDQNCLDIIQNSPIYDSEESPATCSSTQALSYKDDQSSVEHLESIFGVLQNPYPRIIYYSASVKAMSTQPFVRNYRNRLIQACERVQRFSVLPLSDKFHLLKHNLAQMFAIRSVLMFNPDRVCWAMCDDTNKATVLVPLVLLKGYTGADDYQRHRTFPALFRDEWKSDYAIFDLLTMIVLFTADQMLCMSETVQENYNFYVFLLRRYLQSKYYTHFEANDCFQQMMYNISLARDMCWDLFQMDS